MKFYYVILSLVLLSCNANSESKSYEKVVSSNGEPEHLNSTEANSIKQHDDLMLIKEGEISFETEDVQVSRKMMSNAVATYGGYFYQENQDLGYGRINHELVIRVPSGNFDSLMLYIEQRVETIIYKHVQVEDVSEQYLDDQARIRNKRLLEERYLNLLAKSEKLEDMIYLEDQLASLRSTIESIDGKLKKIQNRVSYSTLTITYFENDELDQAQPIAEAFVTGWSRFSVMVIGLFSIWPFVLIALTFVIIIIYKRKSLK